MQLRILFAFESMSNFLVEVKNIELPKTVPADFRLHWLVISKNDFRVQKLGFTSMVSAKRRLFAEGNLAIGLEGALFVGANGDTTFYKRMLDNQVEVPVLTAIQGFLEARC